jgi:hypothetical protein
MSSIWYYTNRIETPRPTTFECNVMLRVKAGIVEPEEMLVPSQRLDKRVPAQRIYTQNIVFWGGG